MEGGRGEGAGGPAAADLRRDMAAAPAACERRIAQGCERTAVAASAFRRAILSARSLAEHSVAHREKLNTLKDHLRGLEASLTEALSTKLKKESECKLTSESISNATATNEQLRSLVLEQRARRDEFANVISHQLQAIEGLEANVDVIGKKNLEEAIMWYNKFLGFQVVAGEGVKFVFNKVDMQSPDDEYLFCIKVNKDEYSLIQCTPLLKDTDELVKDLNCTNDLFKFVRTMRARFQAAAIKGLFTSPNDIPYSIDNLTPEHIEAAKVFIETLASSKKHIDRNVTRMPAPDGDMCTVKMLHDVLTYQWVNGIVINSYSKHLAHRGLHDRQIMSTWLSTSLLDRADGKKKLLRNKKSRNFAKKIFDRVNDEYFARDKAYFPMHVNKNHWITIVMHTVKEEFQVLNSNGDISHTVRKMIETLRGEIAKDINEANIHVEANKFPDVSSWPIEQYNMPLQTDSVSCGLFVLRCIQHWDGDGWTFSFDQQEINASRPRIVAEILFSHTNELDKVKMELLKIVQKE